MELPHVRIVRKVDGGPTEIIMSPQFIPEGLFRLARPYELRRSEDLAIRRDLGIGDILMTTPTLRAIAKRYPQLRITYYSDLRNAAVLEGNPRIHAIKSADEWDEENHEIAVDLNHFCERHPLAKLRPRQELFAMAFGLKLDEEHVDCSLDLYLTDEEVVKGAEYCKSLKRPIIGVAPHTTSYYRDWKFAEQTLPELKGRGTVVWFQRERKPADPDIHWVNHTSTAREWAAVLAHADVAICADSGPLHLATAMQKRLDRPRPMIVALLGVARAINVLTDCRSYIAIEPPLECSPCMHQGGDCGGKCTDYHTPERVLHFVDVALHGEDLLENAIEATSEKPWGGLNKRERFE